ncbi:hypothetical protein AA13595_0524 [Gluconacetobacter johannae DSM 13595]|uniref:Uncharacterized protein n=1 Tax=Gluconacetobacter johannae TaxID=112140 RepID=A0A7W4JAF7_9PROT|nr:hypothetical protein [Gluconacetobacter johannae]MBB2177499.1 hypothetical protein [Gluconacetobacter johannae]GBQ81117.1 hypothetical protein AA13595_0524 [Gluconacetobacter johannae DSM 13595]
MSSKGHTHKHAPGRHKAPHYGAAHYAKVSGRSSGERMLDLHEPPATGQTAKPGTTKAK